MSRSGDVIAGPDRQPARRQTPRPWAGWAVATVLAAALLAACSTPLPLPAGGNWPTSIHRVAPDAAPLARLPALQGVPAGRSGFRPLLLSSVALDTRLALIEQARTGLDLQTHLLGDDSTGHEILRALRDAAGRGVRVRLLIDDLYTAGLTDLLLGLAAHPQVEVRLYNPVAVGATAPGCAWAACWVTSTGSTAACTTSCC